MPEFKTDMERRVEKLEAEGVDCSPTRRQMSCACGYNGRPAYILPYSEIDAGTDRDQYICPRCEV